MGWPQIVVIVVLTIRFCFSVIEDKRKYKDDFVKIAGGFTGTVIAIFLKVWILHCGGFW